MSAAPGPHGLHRGRFPRPSISLLCGTRHPGPLVARALGQLRPVVDEIVIAADDRVSDDDLDAYAGVADVVVRFPFTGANRFRPWLATRARGDWLLLLDGDEVASAELVSEIDEAVRNRLCAGYLIPRRWLYPHHATYLATEPWSHDEQLRLVRNDDRLSFPGTKHTGAVTSGPVACLDGCLYHLTLLEPYEARCRKVRAAAGESFGLTVFDGRPIDEAYYLPERSERRLSPVPAADRRLIEDALRPERPPPGPRARIVEATREEVERFHPDALRAGAGWRARIEAIERRRCVPARVPFRLLARVANTGLERLPPIDVPPGAFNVSYHVLRADGSVAIHDGARTPMPRALEPGESTELAVEVFAPDRPGRYALRLDLVHEGWRWLGAECEVVLDVGPGPVEQLRGLRGADGRVALAHCLEFRRRWHVRDALAGGNEEAAALEAAARVLAALRDAPRKGILYVGFGPRLLAVAGQLARAGAASTIVCLEHDPDRVETARAELAAAGLAGVVRLVHTPLTRHDEPDGIETTGYDLAAVGSEIGRLRPGLVVVEGPPAGSGAVRLSLVPSLQKVLTDPVRLLAFDALRDVELNTADCWAGIPGVSVLGIWPEGGGVLECTIAASADPAPSSESSG